MNATRPSRRPRRERIECDVADVQPDLGTVDSLAYAALTARRLGCRVVLRHASPELEDLIGLAGLAAALPCAPRSAVEARWQAEEREEAGGVEEEGDSADPTA